MFKDQLVEQGQQVDEETYLPRHQALRGLCVIQAHLKHLVFEMLNARFRPSFTPVV